MESWWDSKRYTFEVIKHGAWIAWKSQQSRLIALKISYNQMVNFPANHVWFPGNHLTLMQFSTELGSFQSIPNLICRNFGVTILWPWTTPKICACCMAHDWPLMFVCRSWVMRWKQKSMLLVYKPEGLKPIVTVIIASTTHTSTIHPCLNFKVYSSKSSCIYILQFLRQLQPTKDTQR